MQSAARLSLAIVDDDLGVRNALMRQLRALGHEASIFASAEEFLTQSKYFDCVILDVHLPGMSGIDLAKLLRRSGQRTALVFITGCEDSGVREYATHVAAPWLHKPFDETSLSTAIRRAVAP